MKKYSTLFTILLLFQCTPNVPINEKINDAFCDDFRNINKNIRGTLYLDVFNKNLDSLTYNFYITYMKEHIQNSAKDLPALIERASSYIFKTRKNSFLIGLLYKEERKIIIDDAYTAKLDTIISIKDGAAFPDLSLIANIIWAKL